MAIARKAVVPNADDTFCAKLAGRTPRGTGVIYFGYEPAKGTMASRLPQGVRSVCSDDGMLAWADGDSQFCLKSVAQLPNTRNVKALSMAV